MWKQSIKISLIAIISALLFTLFVYLYHSDRQKSEIAFSEKVFNVDIHQEKLNKKVIIDDAISQNSNAEEIEKELTKLKNNQTYRFDLYKSLTDSNQVFYLTKEMDNLQNIDFELLYEGFNLPEIWKDLNYQDLKFRTPN